MNNLQIAITWTLIHSIWEASVVAAGVVLVVGAVRSSSVRYAVACAGLLGIVAAFVATFIYVFPWSPSAVRFHSLRAPEFVSDVAIPFSPVGVSKRFSLQDGLPWIARLWFIGFAMFNLRHLANWFAARRMRTRGVCLAPEVWRESVKQAAARIGVSKPVMLLESCLVRVPVVMGQIRPMILVPIGLMAGMSGEQIELILMHELAHIRRHDYMVNMLQTFVEGLMFYNPAVWWISTVIRREREHCCDDIVVAASRNAHGYARALAALEEARGAHGQLALASTGGSLVKRINRLLHPPDARGFTLMPLASSILLIVAAAALLVARPAPSAPRPEKPGTVKIASAVTTERSSTEVAQQAPVPVPLEKSPKQAESTSVSPRSSEQLKRWIDEDIKYIITPEQRNAWKAAQKWLGQDVAYLTQPAPRLQVPDASMRWLNEDVVYIITNEERKAFSYLRTDQEREQFIEQFWLVRDPTPGTPENEYRDEHYARIAWANERFTTKTGVPGWKTDRGRISIRYGKPDELESHTAGQYTRPEGGTTLTFPYEDWRYKYIEGVGSNILLEFVDTTSTGEYRLAIDPTAPKRIGQLQEPDKPKASYSELLALGLVQAQVTVIGKVKLPGIYVMGNQKRLTLLQVLAMAQGATLEAGDLALITRRVTYDQGRQTKNEAIKVNFRRIISGEAEDVSLQVGDVILVTNLQQGNLPTLMDTRPNPFAAK